MRLTARAAVGRAFCVALALGTHGCVACAALGAQDALGAALDLARGAACMAWHEREAGRQVNGMLGGMNRDLAFNVEGKRLRSGKTTTMAHAAHS